MESEVEKNSENLCGVRIFCNHFFYNNSVFFIGHLPISPNIKKLQILNQINIKNYLSEEEMGEYGKKISESSIFRRFEWIFSRLLSKHVYNKFCVKKNLPNSSISCTYDIQGIPYINILQTKDKHFLSITHSQNDIFIVISNRRIGIDSELITEHSDAWKKKYFLPDEKENLQLFLQKKEFNISHLDDTLIYSLLWMIKEAHVKQSRDVSITDLNKIEISQVKEKIYVSPLNLKRINQILILKFDQTFLLIVFDDLS
ncbi:MAG: hypothetical protein ACTSVU_02705 [Promethearchaeota archaeon]